MYFQNIIKTIISKFIILILNFLVLVLTTNLWGADGRGLISIIMADIAIIAIFNNILGGNSIVYSLPQRGVLSLIVYGYIWIVFSTIIISVFFAFFQKQHNFLILTSLTLVTSFLSLNLLVFIGKERINLYNLFSFLSPLVLLIVVWFFVNIVGIRSVKAYFLGYLLSQIIVLLVSFIYLRPYLLKGGILVSWDLLLQTFQYGWKNELSYLLQFLNYRLSYFFILYFQNVGSVGLFSVAIAVAESIWLVNKSITTVQYARIVNLDNNDIAIRLTKSSAKISFYASAAILAIIMLIPSSIFSLILGHDFSTIQQLLLLLIPGILSISISNVYGHYFAATNRMSVLIIKSAIGLIFTVVLSIFMIPPWGIKGACIVTSLSYLSTSIYLMIIFKKNKESSDRGLIIPPS